MKVYHGSYTLIEDIDLSKSIPNKDFGKGFYVTKYRQHAESWAKVIGRKHKTEGIVTKFIFAHSSHCLHYSKQTESRFLYCRISANQSLKN